MKKVSAKKLKREFMRNNSLRFVLVVLFGLAADVLELMISPLLMKITDIIAVEDSTASLKTVALETLIVLVGLFTMGAICGAFHGKFNKVAMVNYKEKVMSLITEKDIYAFKGESSATYISALTNDASTIETGYLNGILGLVSKAFTFVGAMALMINASPMLTLITVGLLIIPVIVSILTGNTLVKYEKAASDRNAGFVGSITEILRGFSVVKCFQAEKEVKDLVNSSNQELENVKCKKYVIKNVIDLLGMTAGACTQFGIFLIGALIAIKTGNITAGTLLLFVNLMNYVLAPISSMPALISGIRSSNALINKMADNCSVAGDEGTLEIDLEKPCDIEMKNVSFSYEEGKEVIHNISASFEDGKSYALVGSSGSGKSTVLKLIMSSYENYNGSISIGGNEIRDVKTNSLYDTMSLIEQEVFVFNSTIRENITMFKEFAKEKIDDAIVKAGLSELIQNKGEDYKCGEAGCNLSGGERQRISIARSLLIENDVLLVDEATAALDAETAFKVTNSILDLKDKTRIVVTHDLDAATLSRFDKILALKDGRIVEEGNFDELMNRKEFFYSLFTIAQ